VNCHLKLHIDTTLPYGTRGTRPRQLWGPIVFGTLQLLQLVVFFRWALWEAYSTSPDFLAKFTGRMKEE